MPEIDSEEKARKIHSIYLEIGGNAVPYSINYDLIFYHRNSFMLGGRVGFSIISTNTCPTVFSKDKIGEFRFTPFVSVSFGWTI